MHSTRLWLCACPCVEACLSCRCVCGLVCFPRSVPWPALCVCARTCVLPYCSSCLSYIWNSNHITGAHACFFISLCLLFASVGQASARTIASLPWTLFTSPLTHRLVLLCVDAHCFIFWDLPGDALAAPESALCGWIGVIPHPLMRVCSSALCGWKALILSPSQMGGLGVCVSIYVPECLFACMCVPTTPRGSGPVRKSLRRWVGSWLASQPGPSMRPRAPAAGGEREREYVTPFLPHIADSGAAKRGREADSCGIM